MNLPLNIDVQQILLHMFNFVILFGGLYFILYKPIKEFMANRKKMYEEMDDKAKKVLQDAENTKTEYQNKLDLADNEIRDLKKKSVEEAENEAKTIIESAKDEASEIVEKAKKIAQNEKQDTIKAANREISKIAVDAAKKVVFENTSASYDAFLEEAEANVGE